MAFFLEVWNYRGFVSEISFYRDGVKKKQRKLRGKTRKNKQLSCAKDKKTKCLKIFEIPEIHSEPTGDRKFSKFSWRAYLTRLAGSKIF